MKTNPFQFGGLVDDPYFIDRKEELSEIKISLAHGQNMVIYAPRRYGKTSLIKRVAREMEANGHPVVYLDFFRVYSKLRFIELYSQIILSKQTGGIETALKWFKSQVSGLTPTVSLNQDGEPVFGIGYLQGRPTSEDIIQILKLPEKLYSGKQVVVIFDEFQEIAQLNGESFEKEIRSVTQEQNNVSYVFMGSKTHMILDMFNQKERAFYQSSKLYPLGKIPVIEIKLFITKGFLQSELTLNDDILGLILDWTENIPYYVQFLAAELFTWSQGSDQISEEDLILVMERILNRQNDYYTELMDKISSNQKNVLRALSEQKTEILSKSIADQYFLSSPSSTQRALSGMMKLGVIEKQGSTYTFSDPFFKKYLVSRYYKG
ncbi:MAG: ATP-binding protein [Bacteroidota bacterium]|nr:ATP-binding protein [Bacteroidota bacterium]